MATVPPETILLRDQPALDTDPGALAAGLAGLHGQAASLALLARIACEREVAGSAMTALLARAQPWQRTLVAQGIADCGAMLGTGLAALATLSARGQDCAAPALALWREFHAARAAMLGVLNASEPAQTAA